MRSLLVLLVATAACGGGKKPAPAAPAAPEAAAPATPEAAAPAAPAAPPPAPKHATATMEGTAKFKNVKGTVEFTQVDDGVEVTANIEGLKKGDHGFHIHEKGDCSAPDASSAGGHFNPSNHKH